MARFLLSLRLQNQYGENILLKMKETLEQLTFWCDFEPSPQRVHDFYH